MAVRVSALARKYRFSRDQRFSERGPLLAGLVLTTGTVAARMSDGLTRWRLPVVPVTPAIMSK